MNRDRVIRCTFHIEASINQDILNKLTYAASNGGKDISLSINSNAIVENVDCIANREFIEFNSTVIAFDPKIEIEKL